jgi:hypothetical protein
VPFQASHWRGRRIPRPREVFRPSEELVILYFCSDENWINRLPSQRARMFLAFKLYPSIGHNLFTKSILMCQISGVLLHSEYGCPNMSMSRTAVSGLPTLPPAAMSTGSRKLRQLRRQADVEPWAPRITIGRAGRVYLTQRPLFGLGICGETTS